MVGRLIRTPKLIGARLHIQSKHARTRPPPKGPIPCPGDAGVSLRRRSQPSPIRDQVNDWGAQPVARGSIVLGIDTLRTAVISRYHRVPGWAHGCVANLTRRSQLAEARTRSQWTQVFARAQTDTNPSDAVESEVPVTLEASGWGGTRGNPGEKHTLYDYKHVAILFWANSLHDSCVSTLPGPVVLHRLVLGIVNRARWLHDVSLATSEPSPNSPARSLPPRARQSSMSAH